MILTTQSDFTLQDRGEVCRTSEQDGPACGAPVTRHLCVAQIQDDITLTAVAFYTCDRDARWGSGLVFSHPLTEQCGAPGTQAWYETTTGDSGCRFPEATAE